MNNNHLIPARDGQFTPAKSVQSHWLSQSRLFTSINFEEEDKEKYLTEFPDTEEKYFTTKSNYYFSWGFKFKPNDNAFNDLDYANEMIYKSKY